MLFTSYAFIGFLALTVLLYYLVPKKLQWVLLLAADAVFFLCAGWQGLVYMAATVVVSWASANAIGKSVRKDKSFLGSPVGKALTKDERRTIRTRGERHRRFLLLLALAVDLGILAVLKYTNFVLGIFGAETHVELFVPMGVSFYTFQTVGYLIDVYWEKAKPEHSLAKTALFTSFFPLLVQGPISRFGDLSETLYAEHRADFRNISFGLQRILWGYFKKLVVADRLLPAVKLLCGDAESYSGAYALLGALLYAAELYADFTGGIDITIGIAEMLGIRLQENFIRPYFSRSIAEYWRRWHISMGTWFKDYIFYPLSASAWLMKLTKKTKQRSKTLARKLPVYVSTLVTWFLTGLWHGAAWNFIVWGMLNAVIILAAEEFKPFSRAFREKHSKLVFSSGYHVFEMLRTFLLMCSLRMLDCYRNVGVSFRAFFSVFTMKHFSELFTGGLMEIGLTGKDWILAGTGVLAMLAVSAIQEKKGSIRELLWKCSVLPYALFGMLFLVILLFGAYGVGYDSSQFIYNQF